jgi:hypothetical protein
MSLLFYDEILQGVEQRIRGRRWSLLITCVSENKIGVARLQPSSATRRAADRRGRRPLPPSWSA